MINVLIIGKYILCLHIVFRTTQIRLHSAYTAHTKVSQISLFIHSIWMHVNIQYSSNHHTHIDSEQNGPCRMWAEAKRLWCYNHGLALMLHIINHRIAIDSSTFNTQFELVILMDQTDEIVRVCVCEDEEAPVHVTRFITCECEWTSQLRRWFYKLFYNRFWKMKEMSMSKYGLKAIINFPFKRYDTKVNRVDKFAICSVLCAVRIRGTTDT